MPFALVTIGLVMIVTGAKDTYDAFGAQVVGDFTGPGNFTYWVASLGAVGAVGYVKEFRTFSHAFMALILIAMVIRNGGFFDKFNSALSTGPVAPAANPASATLGAVSSSASSPAPGLIGAIMNPLATIQRGANILLGGTLSTADQNALGLSARPLF